MKEKPEFRQDRLLKLFEIERVHFWFVGRWEMIRRLLIKYLKCKQALILDLGCGTGFTLEMLAANGYRAVGVDRRPEGLWMTKEVLPRSLVLQADLERIPLKGSAFDVVTLFDVLEHVDDRIVLSEVNRLLRPGGLAFLTVPALQWLWSFRDEDAGHLRRYSKDKIIQEITLAKLEVLEIRFYQFLLFPLVVIARLLGRKHSKLRDAEERPLPIFNRIMTWVNRLEVKLSEFISWPWGSSLVVVCRKGEK